MMPVWILPIPRMVSSSRHDSPCFLPDEFTPARGLRRLVALAATALTLAAHAAPVELVEVRISAGPVDAAPEPTAQVIRHFGWAEQEFAKVGARVVWTSAAAPADALPALAAGDTDFAAAPTIAALEARLAGAPLRGIAVLSRAVAVDGAAPPPTLLLTRERFAAAHPQAVARLIRLHERAAVWIRAHPEEAAQLAGRPVPATANLRTARTSTLTPLPSLTPGESDATALKALALTVPSPAADADLARAVDALLGVDKAIKAFQPPIEHNPILAALR